ncbi:MAG: N-acetylneuraminate synthase family protein [Nitrospinota bacterium]|nr:N-acetylneuraminate synthase family protein [Nitrospinota bacterium]
MFEILGKHLEEEQAPLIVAEIGFNHNGDVGLAKKMMRAAAENGADAVKFQTFIGEELVSKLQTGDDPDHPGSEIPTYEFYQRYELTRGDYEALFRYGRELEIPVFSTPFDEGSLDMLVDLGMPAVKIASCDLTNLPFLKYVAQKNIPVVLSSGMGSLGEIENALNIMRGEGNERIILLHCVSNYPAQHEEMNLMCLPSLESTFEVPVGLSDHSMDNLSSILAVALGAVMIEKHFTTDRGLPGVDQSIAMESGDLKALKEATSQVPKILGDGIKRVQPSEIASKAGRRSLVAKVDISPGTAITREMLSIKRPGTGISPENLERVIGRQVKIAIGAEQVISWDMV